MRLMNTLVPIVIAVHNDTYEGEKYSDRHCYTYLYYVFIQPLHYE